MTGQAPWDPDGPGGGPAGRRGPAAVPVGRALVGRADEIAALRRLVTDVVAGKGGAAWLDGEPGIGKSALLAVGLTDARRSGCTVLSARADEFAQRFPLRVLLDAFDIGPTSIGPERADIAALLWAADPTMALTRRTRWRRPPSGC